MACEEQQQAQQQQQQHLEDDQVVATAFTGASAAATAAAAAAAHVMSIPFLPQPAYSVGQDGMVMSEEQLETLRRQISVYSTICQQLVEMHKASLAQPAPQAFAGGFHHHNHHHHHPQIPYDPLTGLQKTSSRQRWSPTQVQLQTLERIFEEGRATPNKQRIKEITNELSRHGPIAETNVYNWFQNRKARAKRKQASQNYNSNNTATNNSSRDDSEADTDGDSPDNMNNYKRSKQSYHHHRDTLVQQQQRL